MSAETLRRAAEAIHHDLAFGQEHGSEEFLVAVADWLDVIAARAEDMADTIGSPRVAAVTVAENVTGYREALAAATAYLGEQQP